MRITLLYTIKWKIRIILKWSSICIEMINAYLFFLSFSFYISMSNKIYYVFKRYLKEKNILLLYNV